MDALTKKTALTRKQEQAAALVADDELTDEQIAAKVGVVRSTLSAWKTLDEFGARVDELIARMAAVAGRYAVARVDKRMARRQRTYDDLQQVIAERAEEARAQLAENARRLAEAPGLGDAPYRARRFGDIRHVAPGMTTGHVVRVETPGKHGVVVEFKADTAILAELRALESEAAKDAGQLVQRLDVTSGGKALAVGMDLSALSEEELDRRIAAAARGEAPAAVPGQP